MFKPMTKTNQEIVEMATAKVGGESALARALGIKVQSVQKWKKIPAERVLDVEYATGIPREQLRPDLYRRPSCSGSGKKKQ
jgi:DNA-binding transcriptional regulator YdaS (Cro superfamily)